MNIRQHARARKGLQAAYIAFEAELYRLCVQRYYDADGDFGYDDEFDDGWLCTHCGGEGWAQVDDPFWDECDEYGYGDCPACSGTGERRHQTVF
jgi:hypothetical protein